MENQKKNIFCQIGNLLSGIGKNILFAWEWGRISASKSGDREPFQVTFHHWKNGWKPEQKHQWRFDIMLSSQASNIPNIRPLVKECLPKKIIFLFLNKNIMLWVLKRTVSLRRFFSAPKTYIQTDGLDNIS